MLKNIRFCWRLCIVKEKKKQAKTTSKKQYPATIFSLTLSAHWDRREWLQAGNWKSLACPIIFVYFPNDVISGHIYVHMQLFIVQIIFCIVCSPRYYLESPKIIYCTENIAILPRSPRKMMSKIWHDFFTTDWKHQKVTALYSRLETCHYKEGESQLITFMKGNWGTCMNSIHASIPEWMFLVGKQKCVFQRAG